MTRNQYDYKILKLIIISTTEQIRRSDISQSITWAYDLFLNLSGGQFIHICWPILFLCSFNYEDELYSINVIRKKADEDAVRSTSRLTAANMDMLVVSERCFAIRGTCKSK